MKKLLFIIPALFFQTIQAQQKEPLKFNDKGEFKIVQFTDVHFKYKNPASDVALECIDRVLDAEKPELVIFTGDVVYNSPADTAMITVLSHVSKRNIPFVVTLGNHDDEQNLTREQLYNVARSVKGNIQPDNQTDFVLRVNSKNKEDALLYVFDSHSYSKLPNVKGYDWIKANQIEWYRQLSNKETSANNNKPLPALAFFHIPLPEYAEAASTQSSILRGVRMEAACCPKLNSGLFTAMKEQGDVMGMFVGHDHDNDYAVMWYDILLAYGRYTGGNTEYNHLPNGARVIVLKEGKREFSSWIRVRTGEIEQSTVYPNSFQKDDWRKRKLAK